MCVDWLVMYRISVRASEAKAAIYPMLEYLYVYLVEPRVNFG